VVNWFDGKDGADFYHRGHKNTEDCMRLEIEIHHELGIGYKDELPSNATSSKVVGNIDSNQTS
jgi:hypothetical protein